MASATEPLLRPKMTLATHLLEPVLKNILTPTTYINLAATSSAMFSIMRSSPNTLIAIDVRFLHMRRCDEWFREAHPASEPLIIQAIRRASLAQLAVFCKIYGKEISPWPLKSWSRNFPTPVEAAIAAHRPDAFNLLYKHGSGLLVADCGGKIAAIKKQHTKWCQEQHRVWCGAGCFVGINESGLCPYGKPEYLEDSDTVSKTDSSTSNRENRWHRAESLARLFMLAVAEGEKDIARVALDRMNEKSASILYLGSWPQLFLWTLVFHKIFPDMAELILSARLSAVRRDAVIIPTYVFAVEDNHYKIIQQLSRFPEVLELIGAAIPDETRHGWIFDTVAKRRWALLDAMLQLEGRGVFLHVHLFGESSTGDNAFYRLLADLIPLVAGRDEAIAAIPRIIKTIAKLKCLNLPDPARLYTRQAEESLFEVAKSHRPHSTEIFRLVVGMMTQCVIPYIRALCVCGDAAELYNSLPWTSLPLDNFTPAILRWQTSNDIEKPGLSVLLGDVPQENWECLLILLA
ncbi:hypothetical protein GGS20DRAFT_212083 [Poronia punctata]|nr:hypothetical protein GGS20DRAFT_212083 [Poronia punctata]